MSFHFCWCCCRCGLVVLENCATVNCMFNSNILRHYFAQASSTQRCSNLPFGRKIMEWDSVVLLKNSRVDCLSAVRIITCSHHACSRTSEGLRPKRPCSCGSLRGSYLARQTCTGVQVSCMNGTKNVPPKDKIAYGTLLVLGWWYRL